MWADYDNGLAGRRLAAIQYVTGENPRVPGRDAVGPFAVNPDGVQVFSLVGAYV